MHFYSIHVIAEYNLSGSEIICRQISVFSRIVQFGCNLTDEVLYVQNVMSLYQKDSLCPVMFFQRY